MSLSRRDLIAGSLAMPGLLAQRRSTAAAQPPNVLLILADDLAAWMLGCYGNKDIQTPNIDRLARGGTRFVSSFVGTPICSASRATLFTGRMPRQHGIVDFLSDQPIDDPPQGQKAPPASFASEVMLSDVLAKKGYRCGYVGKWHMGNDTKPGHSFDYTYTMNGGSRSYTDPAMFLNGEPVSEKGYLTDIMTRRACEYLDQQKAGSPFFLTVGYLNPHTPYSGHPQRYYDLYQNATFQNIGYQPAAPNALREKELLKDPLGNLRKCAASVTALDDQIPVLLKKLQSRGLLDNTIVVFTGDNGFLLGRHGLWSKGLASNPINMYEEVIGVPMIWNWPGRVPPEATRPELVSFYDFVPTICDAADADVPDRNLPGHSYLPLVTGKGMARKERWPTEVYGDFRNTSFIRDKRFKLVLRNEGNGPNEFFDLVADPRERRNAYEAPEYITVRDQMTKQLEAWLKRYSS